MIMWKHWRLAYCLFLFSCGVHAAAPPAVALYYGDKPPLDELRAFDVVVVDPDHRGLDPAAYRRHDSELFAYVSVGEVRPEKPYYRQIPAGWMSGENKAWGSRVLDQSQADWPRFFADRVIAPLWAKGYRGFFFDTLDSYQLVADTPEKRKRQEEGLKAAIREVKQRWPDARLIFNRGFEILPDVHQYVWMVAAESLFKGWDAGNQRFVDVSPPDRDWLLGQLQKVRTDYRLPVLVIDYLPARQRQQARDTARQIRAAGFIPYVTTPNLDLLGVGAVEVAPRKVLVMYNPKESEGLPYSDVQRFLSMPLGYLGLVMEYQSVDAPLPDYPLQGRYAGIVSWFNADNARAPAYADWLAKKIDEGIPVAVFGHFGFGQNTAMFDKLGLTYRMEPVSDRLKITDATSMMGFEVPLQPRPTDLYPVSLTGEGQAQMTLASDTTLYHPAAITPWGGYVLAPYTVDLLDRVDNSTRWYVN
ncbi:MAG TPA: endo alpha-1,4 polygalactosaminidase, partial [Fluviicoccus sp.]|nr:endo alpha-1,4 polygalactosaminidase [Fluviicoccus sp.]